MIRGQWLSESGLNKLPVDVNVFLHIDSLCIEVAIFNNFESCAKKQVGE